MIKNLNTRNHWTNLSFCCSFLSSHDWSNNTKTRVQKPKIKEKEQILREKNNWIGEIHSKGIDCCVQFFFWWCWLLSFNLKTCLVVFGKRKKNCWLLELCHIGPSKDQYFFDKKYIGRPSNVENFILALSSSNTS